MSFSKYKDGLLENFDVILLMVVGFSGAFASFFIDELLKSGIIFLAGMMVMCSALILLDMRLLERIEKRGEV